MRWHISMFSCVWAMHARNCCVSKAHACGAAIGALGAPAAGASPRPENDPEIALPSMEPATEPAIEEPKVPIIEGPCG